MLAMISIQFVMKPAAEYNGLAKLWLIKKIIKEFYWLIELSVV